MMFLQSLEVSKTVGCLSLLVGLLCNWLVSYFRILALSIWFAFTCFYIIKTKRRWPILTPWWRGGQLIAVLIFLGLTWGSARHSSCPPSLALQEVRIRGKNPIALSALLPRHFANNVIACLVTKSGRDKDGNHVLWIRNLLGFIVPWCGPRSQLADWSQELFDTKGLWDLEVDPPTKIPVKAHLPISESPSFDALVFFFDIKKKSRAANRLWSTVARFWKTSYTWSSKLTSGFCLS